MKGRMNITEVTWGWKPFISGGAITWQPQSEVKEANGWLIQISLLQIGARIKGWKAKESKTFGERVIDMMEFRFEVGKLGMWNHSVAEKENMEAQKT